LTPNENMNATYAKERSEAQSLTNKNLQ